MVSIRWLENHKTTTEKYNSATAHLYKQNNYLNKFQYELNMSILLYYNSMHIQYSIFAHTLKIKDICSFSKKKKLS